MSTEKVHGTAAIPWAQLRLKPFPDVALKVLQLYKNERVQLSQISSLITSDAVFSSEVLIVVNSYLFSAREPITSIMHAVVTLGTKRLQGLCLTVGVRGFLGKKIAEPCTRMIWRHSLATAIIAEELAQCGRIDPDLAYTAGMLHDIGRLALELVKPREYCALLQSHKGTPASILDGERALFGIDHEALNEKLIEQWNLPSELSTGDHHRAREADREWDLRELIKMSCRLADTVGFPAFAGCESQSFDELIALIPEKERKDFHPNADSLRECVEKSIKSLEIT